MLKKLSLCAALAMPSLALAENAALIVGVSDYENYSDVRDGSRSVTAARSLDRIGFSIEAKADASRRETLQMLLRMVPKLASADRAIVVLSGNFLNYGGSNWFLAANSGRPTVMNIGDQGIYLGSILDVLAEVPGGAVLVLGERDGARDYRGRINLGLGEIDIPQGVTVIRGTAGQVAAFTRNRLTNEDTDIIAAARADGLTLEGFVPRRMPLIEGFAAGNNDELVFDFSPNEGSQSAANADLRAWQAAQEADTVEAYRAYREEFSNGRYRSEARQRMTVLQNDPIYQARKTEEALNLSRDQRRQIQAALTNLDFNTRGVDGIFGNGSRRAIGDWQEAQGYGRTEYLSQSNIRLIMRQARSQREEVEAADRAYWSQTGASGGRSGLQQYLSRYPEGVFADEAKQSLEQLNQSTAALDRARAEEEALNLSSVIVGLIEFQLAALGMNPGNMDGRLDENARRAIQEYQRSQGLPQTGYISREVIARLINR